MGASPQLSSCAPYCELAFSRLAERSAMVQLNGCRDRMETLHQLREDFERSQGQRAGHVGIGVTPEDGEAGSSQTPPDSTPGFETQDINDFYDYVSQVKMNGYKLQQITTKVKSLGDELMEVLQDPAQKAQKEKQLQAEKENAAGITQSTGELFQKLKMAEDAEKAKVGGTFEGEAELGATTRMIASSVQGCKKNWGEAMKGFIDTEKKLDAELRERTRRHIAIVKGVEPTEEDLDQLEGASDVFAQAMMGKADLQLAQSVNKYAHQREAQMDEILEGQNEIAEMWAQLGVALDRQHEMLNNVYANVERSKAYVKEGTDALKVVPGINEKKKRCQCFIIIGLTVILGVVAVPVAITVTGS